MSDIQNMTVTTPIKGDEVVTQHTRKPNISFVVIFKPNSEKIVEVGIPDDILSLFATIKDFKDTFPEATSMPIEIPYEELGFTADDLKNGIYYLMEYINSVTYIEISSAAREALEYLGMEARRMAKLVLSLAGIETDKGRWKYKTDSAIASDDVALFKLIQNKFIYNKSSACCLAAEYGSREFLIWAHSEGYKLDERVCESAAFGNQLECLQLLRKFDCPWNYYTNKGAAAKGNLKILKWAYENGCPLHMEVFYAAEQEKQFECIRYLIEINCPRSRPPIIQTPTNIGGISKKQINRGFVHRVGDRLKWV